MSSSKLPGPANWPDEIGAADKADEPDIVLAQMERCLAALDRLGADLAAAHLSTAISHARSAFQQSEDGSRTDESPPHTID